MRPLTLLILGWPLAEIAGFAVVGGRIGAFNTIVLVILSAVLGFAVIRRQGLGALMKASRDVGRASPDLAGMLDGVSAAFAGLLLIIPGFLSDALGLLLLIPGVRQTIGAWLLQNLAAGVRVHATTFRGGGGGGGIGGGGFDPGSPHQPGPRSGPMEGEVIDVTFTEVVSTDDVDGKDGAGRRIGPGPEKR